MVETVGHRSEHFGAQRSARWEHTKQKRERQSFNEAPWGEAGVGGDYPLGVYENIDTPKYQNVIFCNIVLILKNTVDFLLIVHMQGFVAVVHFVLFF